MGGPFHAVEEALPRRRRLAEVADGDRDALLTELAAEHRRTAGGMDRARDLGAVDAVIATADTRTAVAAALAGASDQSGPVYRHDNIPL